MKCDDCGSTNIQRLSLYWAGLPSDSPSKVKYAQPPEVKPQYLAAVAVAVVGLVALISGAILLGLLGIAAGVGWGVVTQRNAEAAEAARERWARLMLCHACTGTWVP